VNWPLHIQVAVFSRPLWSHVETGADMQRKLKERLWNGTFNKMNKLKSLMSSMNSGLPFTNSFHSTRKTLPVNCQQTSQVGIFFI